jgi:hypothetical protein
MVKAPKIPPVDEKEVRSLLQRYGCPVPYHEVRTRFLGNIATPEVSASPMSIVKGLWGGELPAFESMEAVNELLGILVNGLWNNLTRHQKRSEPFRLVRTPVEPTREGLAAYALLRRQEIDGFVEGLFNGQEDLDLPEKATVSMGVLGELRAMLEGVHALATDDTKIASDREFAATLKHVQQLTPIIEREMNAVVLACTRARRQALKSTDFSGPTFH